MSEGQGGAEFDRYTITIPGVVIEIPYVVAVQYGWSVSHRHGGGLVTRY